VTGIVPMPNTGAPRVIEANTVAELTATEFLAQLGRCEITPADYVRACMDRIEQYDPTLHAFRSFDRALVEARLAEIEARIARRGAGRMAGVPVAVKDIFNTYDYPTGMGSPILEGYTPGNDARVVSNVRLEDAIVIGKTITAEFAVHSPGATVNPHDHRRTPGTSSSGSAVAVAARMAPIALASQTAGSIIRPASYCGVFGYKPSFGLVPRTAVLKTTDTLDTIGFIARSIDDLALMFEVCRVRGHNYPVSEAALNDPSRRTVAGRPWRVGILRGPMSSFESGSVSAGLERIGARLTSAGCQVFEYRLPAPFDDAHEIHERIYRRALAYYFSTEWASSAALFSPRMEDMIGGGLAIKPEQYQDDLGRQNELTRLFDAEASGFDALLTASTADEAPLGLDAHDLPDHCLIWTMVGAPSLSLPLFVGSTGLPVGLQIVTRKYADYRLLDFARYVMQVMA
jgi:Asp-tRNA(Asn)/Glu-tRNA(Gln) amidotransferase A subunit family amidase